MKRVSIIIPLLALGQTSCIVAGYSSREGWFFWPGGLVGLLVVVAVLFLLVKRRR